MQAVHHGVGDGGREAVSQGVGGQGAALRLASTKVAGRFRFPACSDLGKSRPRLCSSRAFLHSFRIVLGPVDDQEVYQGCMVSRAGQTKRSVVVVVAAIDVSALLDRLSSLPDISACCSSEQAHIVLAVV